MKSQRLIVLFHSAHDGRLVSEDDPVDQCYYASDNEKIAEVQIVALEKVPHASLRSAHYGRLSVVPAFNDIPPASHNIAPACPHNGVAVGVAHIDVLDGGAAQVASGCDVFNPATIHQSIDCLKLD